MRGGGPASRLEWRTGFSVTFCTVGDPFNIAHPLGVRGEAPEREGSKSLQATLTRVLGVTTVLSWLVPVLLDSFLSLLEHEDI